MDQINPISENGELLRKRSLTDEVYEYLSDKIIAGKYSSGDWLRQEDISTLLGVSQTPVREALDRLVAIGLAERVPYRGVRVPILEAEGNRGCISTSPDLRNDRCSICSKSDPTGGNSSSYPTWLKKLPIWSRWKICPLLRQLNKQFHTRIVEAARSPLLNKLYEMTTNAFPDWMLYEYMFRHPELLQSSLKREYHEHKAIVDALASKDPRGSFISGSQSH